MCARWTAVRAVAARAGRAQPSSARRRGSTSGAPSGGRIAAGEALVLVLGWTQADHRSEVSP